MIAKFQRIERHTRMALPSSHYSEYKLSKASTDLSIEERIKDLMLSPMSVYDLAEKIDQLFLNSRT